MSKAIVNWRRDICAILNWQIRQQERYIRDNCSFFVFVGPVESYLPPPQVSASLIPNSVGGIQIGKPEPSYDSFMHVAPVLEAA